MNIWEGIYNSFNEAEKYKVGDGYNSQIGIDRLSSRIVDNVFYNNTPLPFYASLYEAPQILDFGGGIGKDIDLIQNLDFFYTIVENKLICNSCSSKNAVYVAFTEKIPFGRYDIAHFNSSLHYCNDWKNILTTISERNYPDIFILHDIPCGNFKSFVTLQNFYDSKIPVWFLNEKEIILCMKDLGYNLAYSYECRLKYFGVESDVPMDNFSEYYRIKNSKGFVFI